MSDAFTPFRLFTGTPAYGGMVHVSLLTAITDIHQAGIPYSLMTISNESLTTRVRNSILSTFHARREYTHLLFIDGDVRIAPDDVRCLVTYHHGTMAA